MYLVNSCILVVKWFCMTIIIVVINVYCFDINRHLWYDVGNNLLVTIVLGKIWGKQRLFHDKSSSQSLRKP